MDILEKHREIEAKACTEKFRKVLYLEKRFIIVDHEGFIIQGTKTAIFTSLRSAKSSLTQRIIDEQFSSFFKKSELKGFTSAKEMREYLEENGFVRYINIGTPEFRQFFKN